MNNFISSRLNHLWFLLICILIFSGSSSASDIEKAPPDLMKKISGAGDLQKYPDANSIAIDLRKHIRYEANGAYVSTDYGLFKVLTDEGKQEQSTKNFSYYRKYGAIRIEKARVIKNDGTIINVPQDKITDINVASVAEMNIYEPDQRQKVVTFSNLQVGDAIEYFVTDSCFSPPFDKGFDTGTIFQSFDPIIYSELSVEGSKEKPLKYQIYNDPAHTIKYNQKENGDRLTYSWQVENQPRIIQEPAMTPLLNVAPSVMASSISSWKDISRWYYHLADQHIKMNDSLRAEVDTLTKDSKTEKEKIDKIFHFVAQKIRYMGLGTGPKAGFEPKPITETYNTKYGVCRDVAALMTGMLREKGIESYVVLTGVGYDIYKEIPTIAFNHAIVAIKNSDGSFTFADPTAKDGMDWLLSVEHEQDVLVCTPEGTDLARTGYSPAQNNTGHFSAVTQILPKGGMTSAVTLTANGIYDMVLRSIVKAMPSDRLKMVFQHVLSGDYPGVQITKVEHSDPEDFNKPLELKIEISMDNFALDAGNYTLLKTPLSTGAFDLLTSQFIKMASLSKRQYPFALGTTLGVQNEETVILPHGYRVSAVPNKLNVTSDAVDFEQTYTSMKDQSQESESKIAFESKFHFKKKIYSPQDYDLLKKTLRESQRARRGEIILEKTQG